MAERPVEIAAESPVPIVARAIRAARYAARDDDRPLLLNEDRSRAVELLEALHTAGYPMLTDDLRADIRTAARAVRGSSWPGDMAYYMEQLADRLDHYATDPARETT